MISLKEILYDYAYTKGGGLPLTPQEMCNAVVQWVQKYLKDEKYVKELANQDSFVSLVKTSNPSGDVIYNINLDIPRLLNELDEQFTADNFLSAFTLNDKIVGSNSVVVDISNDGKQLVIELGDFYKDRIQVLDDKAILKPDRLTAESVPVVNTTGVVSYKPVSELGGGGNVYIHRLNITTSDSRNFYVNILSSNSSAITDKASLMNYSGIYYHCIGILHDANVYFHGSALFGRNNTDFDFYGVYGQNNVITVGVETITMTSIEDTVKQV